MWNLEKSSQFNFLKIITIIFLETICSEERLFSLFHHSLSHFFKSIQFTLEMMIFKQQGKKINGFGKNMDKHLAGFCSQFFPQPSETSNINEDGTWAWRKQYPIPWEPKISEVYGRPNAKPDIEILWLMWSSQTGCPVARLPETTRQIPHYHYKIDITSGKVVRSAAVGIPPTTVTKAAVSCGQHECLVVDSKE